MTYACFNTYHTVSLALSLSLATHVEKYWLVCVCLCKPRHMHTHMAHRYHHVPSFVQYTHGFVLIVLMFQTLSLWPCSSVLPTFRPFVGSFLCSFGMSKKVLARSGIGRCSYWLNVFWLTIYDYRCIYHQAVRAGHFESLLLLTTICIHLLGWIWHGVTVLILSNTSACETCQCLWQIIHWCLPRNACKSW